MYIDWTYIILVLPAVLFTMWASANVKSTYNKYSRQQNSRGMTGAQAARRVLDANGLQNVAIQQIEGELTDHYDPKANMIRLSADVYSGTSTAAIGVACHQVGHAIQYAQDYVQVKIARLSSRSRTSARSSLGRSCLRDCCCAPSRRTSYIWRI